MASKLLQGVGVLALIALVGGSFAALAVVQSRLHITVEDEEDAAQRGPDPIALLTADVAATRDDVRTLGEGVGTQMQALHDALEGAADAREARLAAEVAQLRRELAALQMRLDQNAAELASSRTKVNEALTKLGRGLQDLAAAVAEDAAQPVAVELVELPPPAVAPVETAPVAAAPLEPAPAPEAEPAPKKGFLSFKLPSQGFAFDQRQRFAIVPSLSRIGFDAKSTLHDFSGVTTAIEGELTANLAKPGEGCGGAVRAKTASLDTGLADRDEAMREILEPAKFPELRFDWSAFQATSVDAAAQKLSGVAVGRLTIHGVAREIAMPVTVAVDASKRLAIDGQTRVKMSDFGVRPPSKLGLISVEDEATLWIALRARTLGLAGEEKP